MLSQAQLYNKWENYKKQQETQLEDGLIEREDILSYEEFEDLYIDLTCSR